MLVRVARGDAPVMAIRESPRRPPRGRRAAFLSHRAWRVALAMANILEQYSDFAGARPYPRRGCGFGPWTPVIY